MMSIYVTMGICQFATFPMDNLSMNMGSLSLSKTCLILENSFRHVQFACEFMYAYASAQDCLLVQEYACGCKVVHVHVSVCMCLCMLLHIYARTNGGGKCVK